MRAYNFDAVVFDLDGVLIDSRPVMEHVFRTCYARFGPGGEPPLNAFFSCMGMPLPDILRELGLPLEMSALYKEMSRSMYKEIRLIPGAHSTLSLLEGVGMPIGLITGKDRLRTLEILSHFNLSQYFDGVVCGDDPYPGKPHPAGLYAIADQLSVAPHRIAIVGDSVLDVRCGQAAGAIAVAVTWGFESALAMGESGADVCVASFNDLDSWIRLCRGALPQSVQCNYQADSL